jgi:hypothetical protein
MSIELSLDIPSIFPLDPSGHHDAPSLQYMGACKLLRKLHSDAALVSSDDSEQLGNGDWLLRDLFHVTIAIVSAEGKVQLVDAPADMPKPNAKFARKESVTTHGIEVHEGNDEPVLVLAEVLVTTIWRCSNSACGIKWRKPGNIIGQAKRCRQCGRTSVLKAAAS